MDRRWLYGCTGSMRKIALDRSTFFAVIDGLSQLAICDSGFWFRCYCATPLQREWLVLNECSASTPRVTALTFILWRKRQAKLINKLTNSWTREVNAERWLPATSAYIFKCRGKALRMLRRRQGLNVAIISRFIHFLALMGLQDAIA